MELRQRLIVGAIWIVVAALFAIGLEPGVPTSVGGVARLFVVLLALFLAVLYLLDPNDIVSKKPF